MLSMTMLERVIETLTPLKMTMNIDDLSDKASNAAINTVLYEVEKAIRAIRIDTSAIAAEHLIGYEAGWKAAKRAAIECLSDQP